MNFRMIGYVLGWVMFFEGLFMGVPLITSLIYLESTGFVYLGVAAFCIICGRLITLKPPSDTMLCARDGFIIVAFAWIMLSTYGALPFFLTGEIPSFMDALFESVSGFTTTGASILSDVEALSHTSLIWRSFTHWVGGMGVLVFLMVFLQLSGGQNMYIMKAESTGPSVGKLVPRVKTTALLLYSIYFVLTLAEFIILICGSMPVFDALNAAFATAGTGGFAVTNAGMGGYSPYVQIVVTVFMVLFSFNFNAFYLLISRKFREAFNSEIRTFLIIVISTTLVISINILPLYENYGDSLRNSAFTVSSIISTTGFATADFNLWPELSRALLVMLMFIGGCAGSTAGGIKVSRIIILCKGMAKELRQLIHPKQVEKIKIDKRQIEHEVVRSVNVYMVCFLLVFVSSMLIISFDNLDLVTNFTAVSATLNNIGPGLELVGPTSNFSVFSDPVKAVLLFDMLAGRLELFPMLLLITPVTWRNAFRRK